MENLTLGGIRANTGEQILFEVLQELGIETVLSEKTTEEIQCEKTTEEIQYTDEELEILQSLANKFGYKDIDALHEEYNFGSGCVNQPSLRSAMNKIVASKRNLFIRVHFAGERDEVIVLPIRNFFLLLPLLRRRRKKGGTQSNEKKTSVQKEDDEQLLGPNPVETATYLFMTYTNLEFSFIGNSDELQKLETMQYEDIEHLINTLLSPYDIDTAYIKKICAEKKTPQMFFDQKFESIKEKNILKWIALYVYKLQHFPDMYTTLEYGLEDEVGGHHTDEEDEPIISPPSAVSTETGPSTADAAINTIIQSKNSSNFGIHTPSGTTQQQNYVTKNNLVTLFQASKKQHTGKNNLSHSGLVIKQPRQFRKDNYRPYGNRQKGNRKGRNGQGNKQSVQ